MTPHLSLARRCEALTSTGLTAKPRLGILFLASVLIVLGLMALAHGRVCS